MTEPLWLITPAAQQASGAWIDDTLRERAVEKGLHHRLDLIGQFPRTRVEVVRGDDPAAVVDDLYYRRGWTDGLPVVPPTTGRVAAMLGGVPAARVIAELDPLRGVATAEKVAANAVLAGCRPEHFPVVLAAVAAIAEPAFNLRGLQTTDENATPLLILNGPLARALDVNASFGALGPGWRANAAIGRALRLVMHNIGGGWPMAVSFAGIGQPGRYTLCLAENEAQSPWPPLHVDAGFDAADSTVTLLRAECAINVTGGIEELASVVGSAASAFSMRHGGGVAVLVAPATAAALADRGWSKADVQRWLHAHGRMPLDLWRTLYVRRTVASEERLPAWVRAAEAQGGPIPAVGTPDDILVFVAGGDVPIAQQVYFPTWGFPPCRLTRRIGT